MKSFGKRRRYERFGETIRYLTVEELQQFLDAIENYRHKLMMRVIYELGCRVGEFVRIQLKHLTLGRNTVYFPAENTKTKKRRVSALPPGLMNVIKSLLRQEGAWPIEHHASIDSTIFYFTPAATREGVTPKTGCARFSRGTFTSPDSIGSMHAIAGAASFTNSPFTPSDTATSCTMFTFSSCRCRSFKSRLATPP
ncbi:MAG: tyrosine-type recombinase/integrase [Planctomycetes bacterium]|nr:tyrosine-type recombinase/integrase [Planctomycetota bacterium]